MANLDTPLNNSPYDEDELSHFKELLKEEQKETHEEIENLKSSIEDLTATQVDEYSSAAHHQGNVGSEEEETGKQIQKGRLETIHYARHSVDARKKDDQIQQPPKV